MTNDRMVSAIADRYTTERELGASGMATVYLAHDIKHEREVAIKVLRRVFTVPIDGGRPLQLGRVPIDGGPFQPLSESRVPELFLAWTGAMLPSGGGKTLYFVRANDLREIRSSVLALSLADGRIHEVLRFDEPSRPHSTSSAAIAEHDGWLYFTLSDFQADIRVASMKGLKK